MEYNVTGQNYTERGHFTHAGPIIDIHAHIMTTPPDASVTQAETMLSVAAEFGIVQTWSMCPPDDIPILRQRFGDMIQFNGAISKTTAAEADDVAYQLLDRFLEHGVKMIKYWSAPRGRERGLFVDAPWRIETTRRACAAGIRLFMVHVGDPDQWFETVYADTAKFGTKRAQYAGLDRMLQMFPDVTWIAAHMGGDVEHPDHLQELLEKYPHLRLDTSATKWQVREASKRHEAVRALMCRFPERFLFGSDLVTRAGLEREHYVSRYWCQRTLWESDWQGRSPIADPDYVAAAGEPTTPMLHGIALPAAVLRQVCFDNARGLIG